MEDLVLDSWQLSTSTDQRALVIPDGCRDIIFSRQQNNAWQIYISPLAESVCRIPISAGTRKVGFRLQPGVVLNETKLRAELTRLSQDISRSVENQAAVPDGLADALEEWCALPPALAEAMGKLKEPMTTVSGVARHLGISVRRLQRLVKNGTGRSPVYWIQLARVRGAARSVASYPSLADLAGNHGYADQAHMTRAFRKWLDVTPSTLKQGSDRFIQLHQSGYG
ncbi:MAG: helix-turn-helix domain-containing protein [Stappiaceae bacterium]